MAPNCKEWKFEATPVNFIAEMMIKLAKNPKNFNKVYHFIENNPIPSN